MIRCLILILVIGIPAQSQGQIDLVKVSAPKAIVKKHGPSVIIVSVEVKDGYHIQADAVEDGFMIPTTLELDGGKYFFVKRQIFPPAKKFKLNGTDHTINVYDGNFEIQTFFTVRKRKPLQPIKGKLNYQACDSTRCLFPRAVEFLIQVEIL